MAQTSVKLLWQCSSSFYLILNSLTSLIFLLLVGQIYQSHGRNNPYSWCSTVKKKIWKHQIHPQLLTFKSVPAATDDEEFSVRNWTREINLTCAIARADNMLLMLLMSRHAVEERIIIIMRTHKSCLNRKSSQPRRDSEGARMEESEGGGQTGW